MHVIQLLGGILALFLMTGTVSAQEDSRAFLSNLTGEVLSKVASPALSDGEREQSFRAIFQRVFMMPEISQMALGRHWRTATQEQRDEFTHLFEDLLVVTWSRRFKDYSGEKIVIGEPVASGDGDVLLDSHVERPGQQPIRVDWRLRGGQGRYRVLDIKIEGVSMLLSYRSEYQSILQNGGVASLLPLLRQKVQQGRNAG